MNTYQNMQSYKNTSISTADRGKLILMIYDHCIKWLTKAKEAIDANSVAERTKSIFKVQDGLTELICALDFEKGGEIAKNLHNLYDFYGRHLSEANTYNRAKNVEDVKKMMVDLRGAWAQAIENVRRESSVDMKLNSRSHVSLVG